MNELESPKSKPRRGRDFLIGFGAATAYAVLVGVILAYAQSSAALVFSVAILLLAALEMLLRKRHYIALGIVTAIVALPFLLIGTCFAIFGLDFG